MAGENSIIQAKAAEEFRLKLQIWYELAKANGKSKEYMNETLMFIWTPHIEYDELLTEINKLIDGEEKAEV